MSGLKISSKNVESQLSQLIAIMSQRPPDGLPSQPELNPRESVNTITLRSGKGYDCPTIPELVTNENHQAPIQEKEASAKRDLKEKKEDLEGKKGEVQADPVVIKVPIEPYKPKIPLPQALYQNRIDPQFAKFLELLKQLKINIPFLEAIAQMPKYAKFLKEF